jgi:hypothetical protein
MTLIQQKGVDAKFRTGHRHNNPTGATNFKINLVWEVEQRMV